MVTIFQLIRKAAKIYKICEFIEESSGYYFNRFVFYVDLMNRHFFNRKGQERYPLWDVMCKKVGQHRQH